MTASPLLMALHSCTDCFGVALQDQVAGEAVSRVEVFRDGRGLSNTLIGRVESLLPSSRWASLEGLAVSTGPGGFTGTRLSVVMARTLAQQLNCPLLGVSSRRQAGQSERKTGRAHLAALGANARVAVAVLHRDDDLRR